MAETRFGRDRNGIFLGSVVKWKSNAANYNKEWWLDFEVVFGAVFSDGFAQ